MSVGMPFFIYLHQFGEHVQAAFGQFAYWVGPSLGEDKSAWRAVDVRVMLPDEDYEAEGYGKVSDYPHGAHQNQKWVSTVLAWSAFGKQLTGLPVDFQVQPLSWANANEGRKAGKARAGLFDLALAHSTLEYGEAIRSEERKRVEALIAKGRHKSDSELAGFVENPPDWEE